MKIDYFGIIFDGLREKYSAMADMSNLEFMNNVRYFLGQCYTTMMQINEYVNSVECGLNNLNDTQLNLTNKLDQIYDHIKLYFVLMIIFIFFSLIMCLTLICYYKKKIHSFDIDKKEIELSKND